MLLAPKQTMSLSCKLAKYVKLPILQGQLYNQYHAEKIYYKDPAHPYVITNKIYEKSRILKWINIFYNKNDVIYFTKYFNDSNADIKILYDYRKQMYEFVKLDRKEHNEVYSNIMCVRSPNGSLYMLYTASIQLENKKTLGYIVYNYTDSRIVYRVIKDGTFNIIDTAPIANSFAPVIMVGKEDVYIELLNLISEQVKIIKYDLKDFIGKLSSLIQDAIPKSYIKKFIDVPISGVIRLEASPEYIMTKYNGFVPIYKKVSLPIDIVAEGGLFTIKDAIVATIAFENNELVIKFSTGPNSHINTEEGEYTSIKIKPNIILLSKSYKINSTYNIKKSHLYVVNKVGENFILAGWELYMSKQTNRDDYVNVDYYTTKVNYNGIDLTLTLNHIILSNPMRILKLIKGRDLCESYNKRDKIHCVSCNSYASGKLFLLNLNKLSAQLQKISKLKQKNESIIVEKETIAIYINEPEIVKRIICNENVGNIEKYKKIECFFTHYLDNKKGVLYIIMIPVYYKDNPDVRSEYGLKIAKVEPILSKDKYAIVLDLGPYLYETLRNSINSNVMLNMKDTFSNILALYEIIPTLIRAVRDGSILWDYCLHVFRHEVFVYDQDLLIRINKRDVVVKDIRYNRGEAFSHWIKSFVHEQNIKRYGNVVMVYWGDYGGSDEEPSLYTAIIVSDNKLVKYVKF